MTYDEAQELNIPELCRTNIEEPIPMATVTKILSEFPFTPVTGGVNMRDIAQHNSANMRRGLLFRSGALEQFKPKGLDSLVEDYNIRLIVDLRSIFEKSTSPEPLVDGAEMLWMPPSKSLPPDDLNKYIANGGVDGFREMLKNNLEVFGEIWGRILLFLADNPDKAVLVHCTAGKDRTGVFAALFLSLAGIPREDIIKDYMLTRVGIEPAREMLSAKIAKLPLMNAPALKEAALNLGTVKEGYIAAFLDFLDEEYGGAKGYFTRLGYDEETILKAKKNMAMQ